MVLFSIGDKASAFSQSGAAGNERRAEFVIGESEASRPFLTDRDVRHGQFVISCYDVGTHRQGVGRPDERLPDTETPCCQRR